MPAQRALDFESVPEFFSFPFPLLPICFPL
jgi:hypothetical protein